MQLVAGISNDLQTKAFSNSDRAKLRRSRRHLQVHEVSQGVRCSRRESYMLEKKETKENRACRYLFETGVRVYRMANLSSPSSSCLYFYERFEDEHDRSCLSYYFHLPWIINITSVDRYTAIFELIFYDRYQTIFISLIDGREIECFFNEFSL
jgi:hypothetical protein